MLTITIKGPLEGRVRQLAAATHCRPEAYGLEIIDTFVRDRRSGKFQGDPERHDRQNPDPLLTAV